LLRLYILCLSCLMFLWISLVH